MPVPSAITDLSTTLASNSPAGSDNVFPDLDNYLRAHAQFVALLRDGRGLSTEVSLASAATCDIGGAASMFVQITGTTTITSFGTNYLPRILRFAGVLTLTHNATTLILPTGANITTAAGDLCLAVPVGTSGWRVLQYQRASEGADFVSFLQSGTGASSRTVQSKLRDVVSVLDFGAVGDGVADDTGAIQAAMDAHDYVRLPPGSYKITTLLFKRNNQVLEGSGFGNTTLVSTVSAGGSSVIKNSSTTVTLVGCELRDLKINAASLAIGWVVNWSHIQLGKIERVWAYGGGANCTGFYLSATWTVTECTYNTVIGCYTGNVLKGFQLGDGANNNVFIDCRSQPAYSGGYGFSLFGTAAGRISSNTIVGGGTEYPGNISGGIYAGQGSDCTTVVGHRFESLSVGVEIVATALKTTLIGNYYDSVTSNILDSSTTTVRAEVGGLYGTFYGAYDATDNNERIAVFNGVAGTLTKGKGTSLTKNGTGDYTISFTTNLKNSTPLVTVSATGAKETQIFTVDNSHVRVKLFDSGGFASDGGYVTVSARAF